MPSFPGAFFLAFHHCWISLPPLLSVDAFLQPFLDGLQTNSPSFHLIALVVLVLLGFSLLTKGGDLLTDGASDLARGLGIHPAVIGLTVVSISTSTPELFTSMAAIVGDAKRLIIGNVVGSNLANVGLILGVATFVRPIKMKGSLPNWQSTLLLLITILFSVCCLWPDKGTFNRENGITFVIILACYLVFVTRHAIKDRKASKEKRERHTSSHTVVNVSIAKAILLVLGATVALWFGSDILVIGAKDLAESASVPQELIGLTVLAIGTSLPELAASWSLAKRGESAMLVGNVIGSNLFNLTFVAGLAGTISPIPVDPALGQVEFPAMLLVTVLLCWLVRREKINRPHGIFLLVFYFAAIGISWVLHA